MAASGSSSASIWDGTPEALNLRPFAGTAPALGLILYGACVLAILTLVFTGFTRDDLETAYYAQGWRFHTHPDHPPLYAWLAQSLVDLLGPTLLAAGLLKVLLLASCFALMWVGVRRLTGRADLATLAVAGLPATHFFGYHAVHNYTHTILLLVAMAGVFCAAAHIATTDPAGRPPRVAAIGLGLAIGIGLSAKLSFLIFAACLLALLPWWPVLRGRAAAWTAIALTAAPGAALVIVWLVTLPEPLAPQLATAMGTHRDIGAAGRILGVLGDAALTPLLWLLPGALVPLLAAPRTLWRGHAAPPPDHRDARRCRQWANRLALYALAAVIVMAGATLLGGGTRLREHYMAPLMLFGPTYLALRLGAGGVTPAAVRRTAVGLVGAVAAYLVALPLVTLLVSPVHCGRCLANLPVDAIGRQLSDAGFRGGMMVSTRLDWLANLRTVFPEARAVTDGFTIRHPQPEDPGACLVLTGTAEVPPNSIPVARLMFERLNAELPGDRPFRAVSAPLAYGDDRLVGVSYLLIPEGLGDCR